jgi:hypothetical protein
MEMHADVIALEVDRACQRKTQVDRNPTTKSAASGGIIAQRSSGEIRNPLVKTHLDEADASTYSPANETHS